MKYRVCSNCKYYWVSMCDDVVCEKDKNYPLVSGTAKDCECYELKEQ